MNQNKSNWFPTIFIFRVTLQLWREIGWWVCLVRKWKRIRSIYSGFLNMICISRITGSENSTILILTVNIGLMPCTYKVAQGQTVSTSGSHICKLSSALYLVQLYIVICARNLPNPLSIWMRRKYYWFGLLPTRDRRISSLPPRSTSRCYRRSWRRNQNPHSILFEHSTEYDQQDRLILCRKLINPGKIYSRVSINVTVVSIYQKRKMIVKI